MKGAILVCGTNSDAGKSLVAAGLCRWLARRGVRVAPFKAQNMALNSVVGDDGGEVGRSQAVQAAAAGVALEAAMNPILLKPSGPTRSQVIVMGRPYADADARSYAALKERLRPLVLSALADLRARFDVVVCEGAGSPAEINLRDGDLVNLGLARAAGLPAILVADIDRGGVFASLLGTLALLDADDQAHLAAFLINKFRGERSLLTDGLRQLEARTGRPVLGVLPYLEEVWLDAEDSLALPDTASPALPDTASPALPATHSPALPDTASQHQASAGTLEVAIVRLRWISNFTDADPLRAEPGVRVHFTRSPVDVERADLVILPGTKATVADLQWLQSAGLARALRTRAAAGAPILGICGGYQMLGERIIDRVESGRGELAGLGLLPVSTVFAPDKLLRRRRGRCHWLQADVGGYEIRHGRLRRRPGTEPLLFADDGEPDGCRRGAVLGISWHGAFEHDEFRRALLRWVAECRGVEFIPGRRPFAQLREWRLDALGDLVSAHLDTVRLAALIEGGVPSDLPVVRTEVSPCCVC